MKKVVMILLGIALVLSMSGFAAAAEVGTENLEPGTILGGTGKYSSTPNTGNVTVSYAVGSENYLVKIPGNVNFNSVTESMTSQISVSSLVLDTNRQFNLSVQSTNGFKIVKDTDLNAFANYTMHVEYQPGYAPGDATVTGNSQGITSSDGVINVGPTEKAVLLSIHSTEYTAEVNLDLTFTLDDQPSALGTYKDVLTIEVVVTDAQSTA